MTTDIRFFALKSKKENVLDSVEVKRQQPLIYRMTLEKSRRHISLLSNKSQGLVVNIGCKVLSYITTFVLSTELYCSL